mgnify:CR=1 FL=1
MELTNIQKSEVDILLKDLILEYNKVEENKSISGIKNILENCLEIINKLLPYEDIINKGDINGKDWKRIWPRVTYSWG